MLLPATVVEPVCVVLIPCTLPASFATTQFAATSRPASPPCSACWPCFSWFERFWFEVISWAIAPAEIVSTSSTTSDRTSDWPRSLRRRRHFTGLGRSWLFTTSSSAFAERSTWVRTGNGLRKRPPNHPFGLDGSSRRNPSFLSEHSRLGWDVPISVLCLRP